MKSTVTSFTPTPEGNFETANGSFFKFFIVLADGAQGSISSKDQNPAFLQVGQELEYEASTNQFGQQLKRVSEQGGGFAGGGKKNFDNSGTIAGWAITQSIAMGNKEPKDIFEGAQTLLRMSDSIATSVKAGAYKAKQSTPQQVAPVATPIPIPQEQAPAHIPDTGNDLPF